MLNLRLLLVTSLIPVLVACGGPPTAQGSPEEGAPRVAAPVVPEAPAEGAAPAGSPAMSPGVQVGGGAAAVAPREDPRWFRPDLFPGATVIKQGRAPADEQGLFASQITLGLAEGTDAEACVERLLEVVGAEVSDLRVEDQGDRRSITGETADYSVILLCGEAKGRMTAYLSYHWTRPAT